MFLVKGGSILPIVLVGLTPLLVFTLMVVGLAVGPVRWQPPNLWSTDFGTSGLDVRNRVTSLSADSEGLYAGGYVGKPGLFGGLSVNATPSQLFVSHYDLSHRQMWSQGFGNFTDTISTVVGATDGVYVVGALNETGFVRKYDLQGNEVWTDLLEPPPSSFSSRSGVDYVSVGPAEVYATGAYIVYSAPPQYYVNTTTILRGYDFTGHILWTKRIGGGINNVVSNVKMFAGANGLYVSGFHSGVSGFPYGGNGYLQRYDFNGTLLWNRQFTCVCWPSGVSGDGTGIYVAGQNSLGIFAGSQAFVAKYDWDGNQAWMHEFRPPNTTVDSLSLSADPSSVYMALITPAGVGDYLSKYDRNGNSIWLFQIPLSPYAISVGGSSVYVGGDT